MPPSSRSTLDTRFTIVTAHPTIKNKFMVVTSERPCAGCTRSLNMCAYVLSPLGDHIFKASKCTHCATTKSKCGQAGALYRFDKAMREGRLIDPSVLDESDQLSSASDTASDSGSGSGSGSGSHSHSCSDSCSDSSTGISSESDKEEIRVPSTGTGSGKTLPIGGTGSERGTVKGSAPTPHRHAHSASSGAAAMVPPPAHAPTHAHAHAHAPHTHTSVLQERVRRTSAPSPSPVVKHRRTPHTPTPLGFDHRSSSTASADSPGKSVRFALPLPSPPLSNGSPTNNIKEPSSEPAKADPTNSQGIPAALEPATPFPPTPESAAVPLSHVAANSPPSSTPASTSAASASTSASAPTPAPSPTHASQPTESDEDRALRIILTKLTEFEQRLGSVEGINTQLRGENRRLRKKNSNLRRVASVVSASQRLSSDMLARALKLVDELETDRRRLIEEIK